MTARTRAPDSLPGEASPVRSSCRRRREAGAGPVGAVSLEGWTGADVGDEDTEADRGRVIASVWKSRDSGPGLEGSGVLPVLTLM